MSKPDRSLPAYLGATLGAVGAGIGLVASVYQLVEAPAGSPVWTYVTTGIIVLALVGVLTGVWALRAIRRREQQRVPAGTGIRLAVAGTLVMALSVGVYVLVVTPRIEPLGLATVELGPESIDRPIVYFGRFESVSLAMNGARVPISTTSAVQPDRCVSTVVFTKASQEFATVITEGLTTGWVPIESAVDDRRSGPLAAIRQQLIVPPPDVSAGSGWTAVAKLVSGDERPVADSAPFVIRLDERNGSDGTWTVAGTEVGCRLN